MMSNTITLTQACNLHFSHVPLELRKYARQNLRESWIRENSRINRCDEEKTKTEVQMPYDRAFEFMRKAGSDPHQLHAIKHYEEKMKDVEIPSEDENDPDADIVWLGEHDPDLRWPKL